MNTIKSKLKEFKLACILNGIEERLSLAKDKSLSYIDFLELILDDEYRNRQNNSYTKRYAKAKFPHHKTIEDFDFSFLFQGVEGVDRYNDAKKILDYDTRPFNYTTNILGAWDGEGSSN